MSSVIVHQGPLRQWLAPREASQRSLGVVTGISWRKTGFDWAGAHEQGWREATARLRAAAMERGASAVINLRHRLCGGGTALGFMLSGDAIGDSRGDTDGIIPCVPFGISSLAVMRRHGLRPLGFAVGLFESTDYEIGYDPVLNGWSSGELTAFNDWKCQARSAALTRLATNPHCGAWAGALDHRETISLRVTRKSELLWSVTLRAAVSRLGFQRHPGVLAPHDTISLGLEDALATDTIDRPVFHGISNETDFEEEAPDEDSEEPTGLFEAGRIFEHKPDEEVANASASIDDETGFTESSDFGSSPDDDDDWA